MRASIDSIKAELGKGEVVARGRQTGKTTALLEFVHEYCCGFCYIVNCTPVMAQLMERKYRQMFPEDEQPVMVTLERLRSHTRVAGRPRCWLTDEVWPDAAEHADDQLKDLTFLGGVGTPMCMDVHSR